MLKLSLIMINWTCLTKLSHVSCIPSKQSLIHCHEGDVCILAVAKMSFSRNFQVEWCREKLWAPSVSTLTCIIGLILTVLNDKKLCGCKTLGRQTKTIETADLNTEYKYRHRVRHLERITCSNFFLMLNLFSLTGKLCITNIIWYGTKYSLGDEGI